MEEVTLSAKPRSQLGSRAMKRLRREGKIPGVVYGRQFGDSLPLEIDARKLRSALQGHSLHSVFTLEIDGRDSTPVLIQDHQVDVVSRRLTHVDLHAISMDEEVQSTVELSAVGVAPGVKEGGILDFVLREITVACLPANIPERVEVDVGSLQIGDSIHVRDLTVPQGVKIVQSGDDMVASLLPPSKAEEVLAAPAGPAEPELVGAKPPEEGTEA